MFQGGHISHTRTHTHTQAMSWFGHTTPIDRPVWRSTYQDAFGVPPPPDVGRTGAKVSPGLVRFKEKKFSRADIIKVASKNSIWSSFANNDSNQKSLLDWFKEKKFSPADIVKVASKDGIWSLFANNNQRDILTWCAGQNCLKTTSTSRALCGLLSLTTSKSPSWNGSIVFAAPIPS